MTLAAGRRRVLLAFLVLLAAGCTSASSPDLSSPLSFERAIVTREHVEEAAAIEAELAKTYRVPAPPGQPWFTTLPGAARVLVVAGHATAHMREGQPKAEDRGTGSLAVMLNRLARSPVIYTARQSPSDPNYYDDNEFKRALSEMLKQYSPVVVLDLHTSHFNRPYDVDFGTMGGASLIGSPHFLQLLARSLRNEGLSNFSQDYFAAARQQTITKWVSRQGVPCIQLEINATWMIPAGAAEQNALHRQRFAQLLQGLIRFVRAVDQGRAAAGKADQALLGYSANPELLFRPVLE